ncbi:MAG: 2OG-Fe(II) oxygenase [Chitinophagales bacterium]|nr:2OG-Fe(II) oxygenase [Chitinophagales bacterium]
MQQFKQEFYLPLKDFESMYAIYPSGAFYKKHTDQFVQQPHRIISLVYYMNQNWKEKDGGHLVIYKDKNAITINPLFNRLVLFKSELWHEVLPCAQKRYSLTSWMKDQLNTINFL